MREGRGEEGLGLHVREGSIPLPAAFNLVPKHNPAPCAVPWLFQRVRSAPTHLVQSLKRQLVIGCLQFGQLQRSGVGDGRECALCMC